jgi:hypothetical protein
MSSVDSAAAAIDPRIAELGATDPDASVAGVIGAVSVRFGAATEALLNKRVERAAEQFRALIGLLAQADALSSQRGPSPRIVKDFLVAIEAAAADEREAAVALGAPVGEAFRLGHSMRCFGRATPALVAGDDRAAHEALVSCGATVLALVSDLRYVGGT